LLAVFVAQIALISSQAIPYSYATGRNVTAVEERFQRFQTAKAGKVGPKELFEICGKVENNFRCKSIIGRSSNSENLLCDSLCCIGCYKVGNCGSEYEELYGIRLDFEKLLSQIVVGGLDYKNAVEAIKGSLSTDVVAQCFCSNDPIVVKCGRDGSVFNIRCPDRSACWRKCCREGKKIGVCEGFLKLQCNCY